MVQKIDLHIHSTFSDGQLSPQELVERGCDLRVTALAVTDHNTLGHLPDVFEAGARLGMEIISGVEISVTIEGWNCHLLSYGFDPKNFLLRERLNYFREFYHRRLQEVAIIFYQFGIAFSIDRAKRIAIRPARKNHIAMAAFEMEENRKRFESEGIIDHVGFKSRYLDKGMPAHIPKARMSAEEAIILTHQAGGKIFLAHPQATLNGSFYRDIIPLVGSLHDLGLDGIEVFHPDNDRNATMILRGLVDEFGLLESAGSDFHGSYPPRLRLGEWQNFDLTPRLDWLTT